MPTETRIKYDQAINSQHVARSEIRLASAAEGRENREVLRTGTLS